MKTGRHEHENEEYGTKIPFFAIVGDDAAVAAAGRIDAGGFCGGYDKANCYEKLCCWECRV